MRTEDGCIINRCLNGEPEAFGLLVDEYKEGIYAFVYSKLRNFQDAQDVTQEVFEQAYRNLRCLKRWESFVFWLYRIASARCKMWIRTRSKRIDRDFIEDQAPEILDGLSMDSSKDSQMDETLQEAMNSLSDTYHEVLVLHYFGGMTIKDIARAIGASPATIGMRLSRARAQLKKEMVAMMSETFQQQKIKAGFTFQIVEMIKRISIQPSSPKVLPWGLSIATGVIIAVLGLGTHLNITNNMDYAPASSSIGEPKVLDSGEFPVDVMKVSDVTVISSQQLPGNGLGNVVPDLRNALAMAPQAGDTWTKKADMPTARFGLSTSVVNGKIYVFSGSGVNNFNTVQIVEEYDPVRDEWIEKQAKMPTLRRFVSASAVNDKIYVIGGVANVGGKKVDFSSVEEYDPKADKWTEKSDMPTARSALSTSAVNGKIYAIGGWKEGNNSEFTIVEEYDPVKDKWTRKNANMPTARQNFSTSVANGKIYAIGGWGKSAYLSAVEEYDPVKDEWTRKANMLTVRGLLSTCVVDGKIYAIGGTTEAVNVFLPTVEVYDPMEDRWEKKSDMPTARWGLSTCAINGKIYAIGGMCCKYATANILSAVEKYDTGLTDQSINFKGKLPTTWGEVRTALNK